MTFLQIQLLFLVLEHVAKVTHLRLQESLQTRTGQAIHAATATGATHNVLH